MKILTSKNYIAVKTNELTDFEKSIFDNMVFPDSVAVIEKADCMIFNAPADVLYNLLYDFSVHFDVELI